MRRWRRELLIAAVLVPVLAGLALVSLRNGASPASTVAPSARPTANSFGSAYVAFLNNRLGAAAVPAVTAASRSLVSTGGRVPAAYQGKVSLSGVRFSGVLGATRANAELIARAGAHTLQAVFTLVYAGGVWRVTNLVPPDFSTVFSPPNPPIYVPPAVRAAARSFALAYADYRTGASARPPAAMATLERQLAAGRDPLAGTAHTGAAVRLVRLPMLVEGQQTVVDAVLAAGARRLSFSFILQKAGGRWQPSSFPESQS